MTRSTILRPLALATLSFIVFSAEAQNVGINATGAAPAASSMLDIVSTNKGLLIPRMTSAQRVAIVGPVQGLLVYETTTNSFWYHNGAIWIQMLASSTGWMLTGNTLVGTERLGSNNAQPVRMFAGNLERMRLDPGGQVVVNNTGAPFPGDVFSSFSAGPDYALNGYATGGAGTGAGGYFQSDGLGFSLEAAKGVTGGSVATIYQVLAANPNPTLDLWNNTGTGPAAFVETNAAVAGADGIEIQTSGNSTNRLIDAYANGATNTGTGITSFNNGLGRAGNFQTSLATNTQPALFASATGNNQRVFNAQSTGATNIAQIGFFSQASTGLTIATPDYSNAASVWGQSTGIRSGIFLAGGGSINTTCLQGNYSGVAGNFDGVGVLGSFAPNPGFGFGVVGIGNLFGVFANGDLGASGLKPFQIDHPLDPENKYLRHFSLESDEVLNLYRGNAVLDEEGKATVQLPSYFHAVNAGEFSYQLTPIGGPSAAYIAEEVSVDGRFVIAGGGPGQKISWTLYAERNDPYVQQNPEALVVEPAKRPEDRGLYLLPELYGQAKEKGIFDRHMADPTTVEVATAAEQQLTPARNRNFSLRHSPTQQQVKLMEQHQP